MSKERQDFRRAETRPPLERPSVIKLFVAGFALICLPVLMVLEWPKFGWCSATLLGNVCYGTKFFIGVGTFLPYVMLIGGIMVAFNVHRCAEV